MRFFGKKKNKTKDGNVEEAKPETSPKGVKVAKVDYGAAPPGKKSAAINPTLDMVSKLIQDLATAKETSGDKPASALRMLFALSEHSTDGETRTKMVRVDGAKLVPVLLQFLQRCARGSSEQYLALLVLNNVSIPIENKRVSATRGSESYLDVFQSNCLTQIINSAKLYNHVAHCSGLFRCSYFLPFVVQRSILPLDGYHFGQFDLCRR